MENGKKVVFKKGNFLGNDSFHSDAMKELKESNTSKSIFRRSERTKEVFQDLKNVRENGVTKNELRTILADRKYNSRYDRKGIDEIANAFDIGKIEKKHCSPKGQEVRGGAESHHEVVQKKSMPKTEAFGSHMNLGIQSNTGHGSVGARFGGNAASMSRMTGGMGRR